MMHKHSLSVPIVPASAPTSPAYTRTNKADRFFAAPVTPQRLVRPQKAAYRSPLTPASTYSTPYTPLSLRSFSSASSSTITTPGSASSFKRYPISPSAENDETAHLVDKSLANIAENWRSRANENGIKVSNADDSNYGDDEASDLTHSDMNSAGFVTEEALLPPPFLSIHRRSQSISSTVPPCVPLSSHDLRTPGRRALGVLNTPPPKPTNVSQLKFKGSFTDPAHTRRRPSFGQMSTELFDIDENAFEPYPQSFSSAEPFALHDPFDGPGLPTISESVQQYFGEAFFKANMQSSATATPSTACSVCGRDGGRIAILKPCDHPLCSGCLTSALNIVGEKAMQCAVCKESVVDFELQTLSSEANPLSSSTTQQFAPPSNFTPLDAFGSPLQRRTVRPLLPSFERTVFAPHMDQPTVQFQRDLSPPNFASAPKQQRANNVVLRIDNVPWDITPPAMCAWLRQPVVRVHVLLDQRGKTLSHAFVELATEEYARAALRGAQNSVLGKGKRARGVTVTRSSQEELMRALFPSWKGSFEGHRPSLTGLRNDQVTAALETGIMTDTELKALLRLVQSPDSHFVKVPSLPFYFLIGILSKFPTDVDSMVFWTNIFRDNLFNITYTALGVLATGMGNKIMEGRRLLDDLLQAGVTCQAFTPQQSQMLSSLVGQPVMSFLPASQPPSGHFHPDGGVVMRDNDGLIPGLYATLSAPPPHSALPAPGPYNDIAREFGVNEDFIQKLAQRLNEHR
ncbi:hypothetical protein K503DRAFT_850046 [Rhizopogon vinicolor AM-OR11-026]|uniref:RING-type domain-containing protein n=1 Tax=Rhizopogon vinicolor AM-OR11-026 TaxID=1314800 RepID=A0A1B7N0I3_9AGAM|nr:hypothetical protein K503DRAFT_850046 [Rhizopogon vinicolor AM-OR11-026]